MKLGQSPDVDAHVTLGVIADELGVCRERVRQIEVAALRKMRRRLAKLELARGAAEREWLFAMWGERP